MLTLCDSAGGHDAPFHGVRVSCSHCEWYCVQLQLFGECATAEIASRERGSTDIYIH